MKNPALYNNVGLAWPKLRSKSNWQFARSARLLLSRGRASATGDDVTRGAQIARNRNVFY